MSLSIYNNSCPSGRMRLPLPEMTTVTNRDGVTQSIYTIDSTKIVNNTFVDRDLCYNLCSNGDIPHFDKLNGLYYCVAPAQTDKDGNSVCLSTDMDLEGNINFPGNKKYNMPPISTLFEIPTLGPQGTQLLSSSSTLASYPKNNYCKRPIAGIPSKATLFRS